MGTRHLDVANWSTRRHSTKTDSSSQIWPIIKIRNCLTSDWFDLSVVKCFIVWAEIADDNWKNESQKCQFDNSHVYSGFKSALKLQIDWKNTRSLNYIFMHLHNEFLCAGALWVFIDTCIVFFNDFMLYGLTECQEEAFDLQFIGRIWC